MEARHLCDECGMQFGNGEQLNQHIALKMHEIIKKQELLKFSVLENRVFNLLLEQFLVEDDVQVECDLCEFKTEREFPQNIETWK